MAEFRLRQVAFVSDDLDRATAALATVLGIKAGHHDPQVADYGLKNAVFPVGNEFIEVIQPISDDTTAERYLERRGGEAGYMMIFQTDDAVAEAKRVLAMGVRPIEVLDLSNFYTMQFHPSDVAGVLSSIDMSRTDDWRRADGDWYPAGPHWRDFITPETRGIIGVIVQHDDPQEAAESWSAILEAPVTLIEETPAICLAQGRIRFVPPQDQGRRGVVGIEIRMTDPAAALDRAAAAGFTVEGDTVHLFRSRFRLLP